ncbi:MAG: hypothetical protein VX726_13560 [Planctomycetota bacterium]|nr:hypothetical protein [Planctomycetota bacterium]
MAQESENGQGGDGKAETGRKSSGARRVGMLTVVLLLVEAVAIGGGFMLFTSPSEVEAEGMALDLDMPEYEVMLEEVVIFDGALGNESTGVALRYPTRVFLKVDARDRLWIESEASRSSGTIHAQLSEIWKLAARRELESPDMAAIESRIKRSFEQKLLFDRRPAVMPTASAVGGESGDAAGASATTYGDGFAVPEGEIIHDVIVVMDIGRRVHR